MTNSLDVGGQSKTIGEYAIKENNADARWKLESFFYRKEKCKRSRPPSRLAGGHEEKPREAVPAGAHLFFDYVDSVRVRNRRRKEDLPEEKNRS